MYAELLSLPARATDSNNNPVANARWYFYAAGTTTALPAYADPGLSAEHPNPLICDNAGAYPPVYFDPARSYRAVLLTADGRTQLADLDPANANLGAAQTVGDTPYLDPGAGAKPRPVVTKLIDGPVDVADFGVLDPTGATDMTAIFTAAYQAAAASGRPLRLPAGTFAVAALWWDQNVEVFGQGAGRTIFRPTVDDTAVISVVGDTNDNDRTRKRRIRDFGIHLGGAKRCVGLYTAFGSRTTLERIGITGDEFFVDDAGYDQWALSDNTGWLSWADQYCNFQEIHIERLRTGFVMRPDPEAGGAVNNIFDGLHICYVQVGAMIFDDVGYGVGVNFFRNFKLQVCTHCALYARNIHTTAVSGIPIEYSGFQRPAVTLQGQTVKGSSMHLNSAQIRFEDVGIPFYQLGLPQALITPAPAYPLIVENASRVTFANGAANGLMQVDSTSTCDFEGSYGNGALLDGARVSLHRRGGYGSMAASTPLAYAVDTTLPNAAPNPVNPVTMQSSGVTRTLNGDAKLGVVTRVAFTNQPSSAADATIATNAIYVQNLPGTYSPGDTGVVSIPVMAESDTILHVRPNGLGSWQFPLKAGEWRRLFMTNAFDQAIGGGMTVGPVGTDAPAVNFGPVMSIKNATAAQLRRISEGHYLNPNDPQGVVLRAAAAPTTGTWPVGAMVYNTDLNAAVTAWRCIAAGTPGTWEALTKIVRKVAAVTPANGFTLPGDSSDMQVRTCDTTAVLQGRIKNAAPATIPFNTTIAGMPLGCRPTTTLRPIMLGIYDGGMGWEAVPAALDTSGNLTLLKATTITAVWINVNAAFALPLPT
ncbi:hypothetical protein ACOYW6_01110 [Parablastomonas sp. CN1-191]|uniref:hypothetical protein n=1 Tax=Parablastomonas sp. CN1-191 TaxID=3400908 RepID=UPI003BF8C7E1